jgi:phosphoribosylglycinamide formyltransferase 1
MKSAVVLISGRGSNLQAILEAKLSLTLRAVISNRAQALGLQIAQRHAIATAVVDHTQFKSREAFDAALAAKIDEYRPDFIALAGFMRVLSEEFVNRYRARLINIHPSLLPAFPGLHTHRRALEAGVKIHGCTVHFVTEQLDCGPIIIQAAVPVLPDDSEQTLAARVLQQEHVIYPRALDWLAQGKAKLAADGQVIFAAACDAGAVLISPKEHA